MNREQAAAYNSTTEGRDKADNYTAHTFILPVFYCCEYVYIQCVQVTPIDNMNDFCSGYDALSSENFRLPSTTLSGHMTNCGMSARLL